MSGSEAHAQRAALKMAAHWHAVLGSEQAGEADHRAWRDWHAQPLNQWAWQRVEALRVQLRSVPGTLAYNTLDNARSSTPLHRRNVLKGLFVVAGAGGLVWTAHDGLPLGEWLADYRTATGERRRVDLADGSRLTLNTASSVDIRFDGQRRLVELRSGEILIETAKDSARPFIVQTRQGTIRALGTRFIVRQHAGSSEVSVLEHAVAVRGLSGADDVIVRAGQTLHFDGHATPHPQPADPLRSEWAQGRLVISDWRLDQLLAELGRYRPGLLGCDPSVAGLRLSGAYPLDDTDRALTAIARAVPVEVVSRTRYWVRLVPRG